MQHTETISVDGFEYEFTHLPATTAYKLQLRLVGLIGKPLGAALRGMDMTAGLQTEINLEGVLSGLAEKLSEREAEMIVKDLLQNIRFDGKDVSRIFDTHFAGRMGHMWKVLATQVRFQFADFFVVLSDLLTKGQERLSEFRKPSSGPSGVAS